MSKATLSAVKTTTVNLNDKAWARWTALGLLAFAMFCSYIFMDILSPIKAGRIFVQFSAIIFVCLMINN